MGRNATLAALRLKAKAGLGCHCAAPRRGPLVPAEAGTQPLALDSQHKRVYARLPTRYARE